MGSRGLKQWVVTSISHMGEILDSDWSRQNVLRSDWLLPSVALITTLVVSVASVVVAVMVVAVAEVVKSAFSTENYPPKYMYTSN